MMRVIVLYCSRILKNVSSSYERKKLLLDCFIDKVMLFQILIILNRVEYMLCLVLLKVLYSFIKVLILC